MDIREIANKWREGYYSYNTTIPATVNKNYVFDENLSVKKNREMVEAHNEEVNKLKKEIFNKKIELLNKMREDVVEYILDCYDLNKEQAKIVESHVYADKHSYMENYFNSIDTWADFAEKIFLEAWQNYMSMRG